MVGGLKVSAHTGIDDRKKGVEGWKKSGPLDRNPEPYNTLPLLIEPLGLWRERVADGKPPTFALSLLNSSMLNDRALSNATEQRGH